MSEALITGATSAETAPKLDITSMRAAAHALVNTGQVAAPVAPVPPAPIAPAPIAPSAPIAPVPQAAAPGAPVAPVAPSPDPGDLTEAQINELPDDQRFRFMVNGRPTVLTGAEAKRMMISGASYTQGMQQVRAQEKAFVEALGVPATPENLAVVRDTLEKAVAMESLLTDPTKLQEYYASVLAKHTTQPLTPTVPSSEPPRLLTQHEAEQLFTQRVEALRNDLLSGVQSAVGESLQTVEVARDSARLRASMDAQIDAVAKDYPVLSIVPDLHRAVREQVKALRPQTEQELALATANVLSAMVDNARPYLTKPADAARLAARVSVEAPAGSVPPVPKVSMLDSQGKFDFSRLRTVAKTYPTAR